MPNQHTFLLNPPSVGLPSREELLEMRIWDLHYHGADEQEEIMPFFDRMGVERVISLDVARPGITEETLAQNLALLDKWKHRMSGIIRVDPSRLDETLGLMRRLIQNGPCIGIKYSGRNAEDIDCSHPNNDPIIRLAAELGAVVYIHTWILVGGEPRTYAGGMKRGESTPMDVAVLASRFPDVPLICGHSGGDWELGIRAIREHPNVLFEFSGGDSWNGVGDMALKELGADRLVWGSHAPSRSFATELSKIYSSEMSKAQRKAALGTNLRRIAAPIMRSKGFRVEV